MHRLLSALLLVTVLVDPRPAPAEPAPAEPAPIEPAPAMQESAFAAKGSPRAPEEGIWLSAREAAKLPTQGKAWRAMLELSKAPVRDLKLADQDDSSNVRVLAKALVYARTNQPALREEVAAACEAAIGTETGGRTLALGRNLAALVIAADLVGLPKDVDARFRKWLRNVTRSRLDGMTLIGTHEDRPNNWGTHAGASRAAVAVYLDDTKELERVALVFRGWLGDRKAYAGFRYRALGWQADPNRPVGINAKGAEKNGHSIDGVLPDDQRRGGDFAWPPPKENYVYEALQGALVQAVILERAGYDPWEWSDRALLRAFEWLHSEAGYPPTGDDCWQSHVINRAYGTDFPAAVPTRPGKNVGFTDWTHPPVR